MAGHYAGAAREAGISGRTDDALTPLIANLDHSVIQPPLPLDSNAETILRRYQAKEERYKASGIYLGQSLLAMLSENVDDRKANPQTDMDFWGGRRPERVPAAVHHRKAQSLAPISHTSPAGSRSASVPEQDGVTLECRNLDSGASETISARKLLLAAGAINSGRLALASSRDYQSRLPILCNPNHWVAAVNLSMLGKPARDRRHSLSQLTVLMRAECDGPDYVLAQIYSYRSLLLFRLLKDIPLPPKQGLLFLRLLATAFTCVNIHFPDRPSTDRWIQLEAREIGRCAARQHQLLRRRDRLDSAPRSAACCASWRACAAFRWASTSRFTAPASITRALCLMRRRTGRTPPRRMANCATRRMSTWPTDPVGGSCRPKGLTLTLMANARRVAAQALQDLAAEEASSS